MGDYYLYRHIRLDNNEVFYIGIGKKRKHYTNYRTEYCRAFSIKRSNFWKKIINKTDYKIEIVLESTDRKFIENKEVEFIKLYGRRNLKQGTLVNLTDGGEGVVNHIPSKLAREKSRERIISMNKSRKYFKKPYQAQMVLNLETGIIYDSMREAYNTTSKYTESHFHLMLANKTKNKTNFIKI